MGNSTIVRLRLYTILNHMGATGFIQRMSLGLSGQLLYSGSPRQRPDTVPASEKSQRIAIIGSGIAGLSAAWLLAEDHDVTLFEAAAKPGMGIYSVDIPWARGITSVDIPLRVFTPAYYPNLIKLYTAAGIATESTDHSAGYANQNNRLFFHYGNRMTEKRSISFPKAGSLRYFLQHLRVFRALRRASQQTLAEELTFGDLLRRENILNEYSRHILLPALATVCTCDYDEVLAYPADILVQYLCCGVMEQGLRRASAGVSDVVSRLTGDNVRLRCASAVEQLQITADGVCLSTRTGEELFDRVVIATQPHQAADILQSVPQYAQQAQLLRRIPLASSRMQLHTDQHMLPHSRFPLSPVTYFLDEQQPRPEATVDLTRAIHGLRHGQPLLQVWNPLREPAPDSVLADVHFTRPLVTPESRRAVRALQQQQAEQPILLTGSYLCDGIPLLDGAVDASLAVARLLGSRRAW